MINNEWWNEEEREPAKLRTIEDVEFTVGQQLACMVGLIVLGGLLKMAGLV